MTKTKEKDLNIISPVNVSDRRGINISPGDTVRVWIKVEEKGKTRLQPFEGVVLARKHGSEAGATFTVRRVSSGVGVEKIFPLYSPNIDKIEIIKRAKTRRAKLYHIRDKAARQVKRQMRRARFVDISTESDIEAKAKKEKEAEEAEEAKVEADKGSKEETQSPAPQPGSEDAAQAETEQQTEATQEPEKPEPKEETEEGANTENENKKEE